MAFTTSEYEGDFYEKWEKIDGGTAGICNDGHCDPGEYFCTDISTGRNIYYDDGRTDPAPYDNGERILCIFSADKRLVRSVYDGR